MRISSGARSLTFCCGLAAILIAWLAARTPPSQPVDAPADSFSADRAMLEVAAIARKPHPTGSAEAARVRGHLIDRLQGLGLRAAVQEGTALTPKRGPLGSMISGATVRNVVGVLPGHRPELPALAIIAHYDTVPSSPGAADDGAGVATMVEVARALRAGPTLARDVIFIFTDAEEAGLLGARAFFDSHPLAQRIGMALNLEARGSGGLAMMFETSAEAGPLVRLFGTSVERPIANSLMNHVYRRLPNGTDFTVPKERGIAGLNLAFIEGQFDYHAASATAANLDRGSVQHMGDQTLDLVRRLADQTDWPAPEPDPVYFDLLGLFLISYPAWTGWILIVLTFAFSAVAFARVRQTRPLRLASLMQGVLAALYGLTVATIAVRLAFRMLGGGSGAALLEGRETLAQFPVFMAGQALLAIGALLVCSTLLSAGNKRLPAIAFAVITGAACSLFGGMDPAGLVLGGASALLAVFAFRRAASNWAWWFGFMLLGLLGACLVQIFAAPAAFLLAWPLLAAALTGALLASFKPTDGAPVVAILIAALVATLGVAQTAHLARQLFVGVGFGLPEVIGPFAALALLPLLALASPSGEPTRAPAVGALAMVALGVSLLFVVGINDPTSPRFPRNTQVFHISDAPTGQNMFASALSSIDSWTRTALQSHGGSISRAPLPSLFLGNAWIAAARPIRDSASIQARLVATDENRTLLVIEAPGTRELRLSLRASVPIQNVLLEEHSVDALDRPGEVARIRWQGDERLTLSFDTPERGRLDISIAGIGDESPAESWSLPPMPPHVVPWGMSHVPVIVTELRHSW